MRYLMILALLVQAPKPLTADNRFEPPPILLQDNGRTVLTVKDTDIPVGPCDFGKLVRAARAHLDLEHVGKPPNQFSQYATTVEISYCRDVNPNAAECELVRAERRLVEAKAAVVHQAKLTKALIDLRSELARCEPKMVKQ